MALSYEASGVNYDRLDAFKRACQKAARETSGLLAGRGYAEPPAVRGESAYLVEAAGHYLAHVEEGLGTKNLVADEVARATGKCHYRSIGIDTVATIVNDLVTCGALPISVAMHAAVGDSEWFADGLRASELAEGFAAGCRAAGAVWGGGETPTLRGVVVPGAIVLGGSSVGRIEPKSHRILGDVSDGDAIVFLASNGVHTNGLTLCRQLAERLPQGYRSRLETGEEFGEALLAPSAIYVGFVAECQKRGITLKYAAHVTGHGWRKLMRLEEPFVHEITSVREAPPLFRFLMSQGPISTREAYGTFNMGIGFAVWVPPGLAEDTVAAAKAAGHEAWIAGRARREGNRKAVVIPQLGLIYEADSLQLR